MAAKTTDYPNRINLDIYNMNDFDKVEFNGLPFILYDTPQGFHKFFIPKGIDKNNAHEIVMRAMVIFVCLNPEANETELLEVMKILNNKAFNTILPTELDKMVDELIYLKETGRIVEVITPNVERYFSINPALSDEEKRRLKTELGNVVKGRKTRDKIIEALEAWRPSNGKPTNQAISMVTGIPKRTIDNYGQEIKKAKEAATKRIKKPKVNTTLEKLIRAMKEHDLSRGLPTYQNVADVTGYSLDTVKTYGKYLKPLKVHLKKKRDAIGKQYAFFAPFDGTLEDVCKEVARTTYSKKESFREENTGSFNVSFRSILNEQEIKEGSVDPHINSKEAA